jgi:hypothetical protein
MTREGMPRGCVEHFYHSILTQRDTAAYGIAAKGSGADNCPPFTEGAP